MTKKGEVEGGIVKNVAEKGFLAEQRAGHLSAESKRDRRMC